MNKEDLYNILVAPVVTEKANTVAEKRNQVVFRVLPQASKAQVKNAFEMIFDAKVSKVTLLNVKYQAKRFGRVVGRRANWKKAYICLVPGQKFDLAVNQK